MTDHEFDAFALAEQYLIKAEQAARAVDTAADETVRAYWCEIANGYTTLVQAALNVIQPFIT